MKSKKLQQMINRIIEAFDPPLGLSSNQLFTRCTVSNNDAPVFFRALGELLLSGRLEKLNNDSYRLKQ